MPRKPAKPRPPRPPKLYFGPDIPMRVIRRFARQVAEKFRPEKIILFGSFAYGTPNADSDVDLLVIMPARNEIYQAFKIRLAFDAPFPMDLLVRPPKHLAWRLAEKESFHTEVMTKGKVLYEAIDPGLGQQGRSRSGVRTPRGVGKAAV
jgi:predicted nucleotidyltransferase